MNARQYSARTPAPLPLPASSPASTLQSSLELHCLLDEFMRLGFSRLQSATALVLSTATTTTATAAATTSASQEQLLMRAKVEEEWRIRQFLQTFFFSIFYEFDIVLGGC